MNILNTQIIDFDPATEGFPSEDDSAATPYHAGRKQLSERTRVALLQMVDGQDNTVSYEIGARRYSVAFLNRLLDCDAHGASELVK